MTTATAAVTSESRGSAILYAVLLPATLVVLWQMWALTLPANSPAPAPARVVSTFVDLVGQRRERRQQAHPLTSRHRAVSAPHKAPR